MPGMWGQHNNSDIFVNVGIIDAAAAAGMITSGQAPAQLQMFKALVDTGAQRTMISDNVVRTLGLTPIGKMAAQGVGPVPTYHNAYLFHIAFAFPRIVPGQQIAAPGAQIPAIVHLLPSPIYGGEITSTGGAFDVLLGMDVISTGSLKVENQSFSFFI